MRRTKLRSCSDLFPLRLNNYSVGIHDSDRKTSISFVMNMLLTKGNTSFKEILNRNYEYNSYHRRPGIHSIRKLNHRIKSININEIEWVRILSSYYPVEMDYVKAEYAQWIEAPDKILTPALINK